MCGGRRHMHFTTHTGSNSGAHTRAHSDTDICTNCDTTRLCGVVVCVQFAVHEGVQYLGDEAG